MKQQEQDSVATMGTYKVRHGFGLKLFCRKTRVKGKFDHQRDRFCRNRAIRIAQSEVSDFHKALWKHMLQEPGDEIESLQACGAPAVGIFHPVLEEDPILFDLHDSAIGDRDLEKVL